MTCLVGEVTMLVHIAGKERLQVPDFKTVFEAHVRGYVLGKGLHDYLQENVHLLLHVFHLHYDHPSFSRS